MPKKKYTYKELLKRDDICSYCGKYIKYNFAMRVLITHVNIMSKKPVKFFCNMEHKMKWIQRIIEQKELDEKTENK